MDLHDADRAQRHATFERDGRWNYVWLRSRAHLLQGEYELKGGELSMARPTDPKMTGLVWRVKNKNLLKLVEHPVSSQFGSDYRGAVLVRRLDGDSPVGAARGLGLGRKTVPADGSDHLRLGQDLGRE